MFKLNAFGAVVHLNNFKAIQIMNQGRRKNGALLEWKGKKLIYAFQKRSAEARSEEEENIKWGKNHKIMYLLNIK